MTTDPGGDVQKAGPVFAPAKLNLSLHVTGLRADGYHLLDSLVVFADIGDRLWFEPGPAMSLEVAGSFADGVPTDGRNLVWRAAELCGWVGHIRLEKNLPHGAGIGGGSSDAAAVLRHLGGASGAALTLGADVPVCLCDNPQRMLGIGEQLENLPWVPDLYLVLVNPGSHVPTPSVFSALEHKENSEMSPFLGEFITWLAAQRNDLQAPAMGLVAEIAPVLEALNGAVLARMSGSGATCFGIYPSAEAARDAAAAIAEKNPSWWVRDCGTFGSGHQT